MAFEIFKRREGAVDFRTVGMEDSSIPAKLGQSPRFQHIEADTSIAASVGWIHTSVYLPPKVSSLGQRPSRT